MKEYADQTETMAKIIIRQDQQIQGQQHKNIMLEKRSMNKKVIITGNAERSGENCTDEVQKIFNEKLELDNIRIKVAHRLGNGKNRPIVAELESREAKRLILTNKAKLGQHGNEMGKRIFIYEQLPEIMSEQRKHSSMMM